MTDPARIVHPTNIRRPVEFLFLFAHATTVEVFG